MRVQHNINALNASRNLGINNTQLAKKSEKLSSGYRVNRAADDAAGLAISEKMRNQIRGLHQASTNAQNGISLIQTAEGAMNEVHSVLQRMSELAVQSANDTNDGSTDRKALEKEFTELKDEIQRIGDTTEFNQMKLLNGNFEDNEKYLHIGANKDQILQIKIKKLAKDSVGENEVNISNLKIDDHDNSEESIDEIQKALNSLSLSRADLGAKQNRLEHTVASLDVAAENAQSSESLIRDVNMAEEMVEYSKYNILLQASQSMLAQANQSTQGVLSLF